ncbi:MAG: DUF2764 domain-containing protein [Candidatus Omnitrophica bacterium]|nr:DUF2764 domain-containing protein [Candidatus Omnitrophota bacterium]MBU1128258.1 DUF2764 domain-containing protein [Candidatus Omnitrophota bacterium]MBU1851008.1 DUF2764 domain-containing protein [Candidatus Omnitrophota bacterium]
MRNKYYYLVASLPRLSFDGEDFLSRDKFMEECRRWLSAEDMKRLAGMDAENPGINDGVPDIARRWKAFDMETREILFGIRTKDSRAALKENLYFSKEKIEGRDPLSAEKAIAKARWDFVEGEEPEYMFDVNWLMLYYVKLQILERLAQFTKEKGKETFQKLCEVKNEQKNW